MEFGKLVDISHIDFTLPEDSEWNKSAFRMWEASPTPAWFTGCTGWAMKEWVGRVYPSGTKNTNFLFEYGKQFNTIELNVTHYQIPDQETILKWNNQTPSDFRFCPKVYQGISHSRNLGQVSGQTVQFCRSVEGLGDKLGPCFLQLPPGFGPESMPILHSFLETWPRNLAIAVEFRHEGWFKTSDAFSRIADLLLHFQAGIVLTDVAGRRDVLHMCVTAPFVLVRFVGNGLHPTDYSRAEEWVSRLGKWIKQGVAEIYFFTHEPDNLLAPEMAHFVTLRVAETLPRVATRGPQFVQPPGGNQLAFF